MTIQYPTPTWNRLIRFISTDGRVLLGEPVDGELDIGLAMSSGQTIEAHVLGGKHAWEATAVRTGKTALVQTLLSPISQTECPTIRCTGLSYKDHADELGLPHPKAPVLFFKPNTALNGPNATVRVPKTAQNEDLDYEVELAVVIGRDCRDVSEEDAPDYVLGYTCANDLTSRQHQGVTSQWGYCKGFDGFCPLGPVMVSHRSLPDPHVVKLQTRVNDHLVQNGAAEKMIFSIPHVISYLSQGSTLPAGSVIITGTPPGIGVSQTPPLWLKDGDEVRCWISHGVGTLAIDVR
ncbi:fumarylacetoacetate hydrolase [Papiliotrema laurentii]|uniref:Fumarylacetoacetate hydrolase n=1 Tax=Papiliotrema laurentii TaxID=5418 RepID=A0AAD9FP92_PAPLA|nr:fumarylacetoacetate hydrolase [Papiliotrema laurentii]